MIKLQSKAKAYFIRTGRGRLRVLHLSTSVVAQSAAYRLHKGLMNMQIDSNILVGANSIDGPHVIAPSTRTQKAISQSKKLIDILLMAGYRNRARTYFSPAGYMPFLHSLIPNQIMGFSPDIIHLHWICAGFMAIENMRRLKSPLIWTLHDSWAFTGGCHIPADCTRYYQQCGNCPQLNSNDDEDLSRQIWKRKKKVMQNIEIFVTPSRWMAACAKRSSLLQDKQIIVIPNGLDINLYKPIDKMFARKAWNLPLDKKLILFGALNSTNDLNKGFAHLKAALERLANQGNMKNTEAIVFGASEADNKVDLPLNTHFMGRVYDDISLLLLYSAADVFVAPSLQDNLPGTVMEALACGIPCVAFEIGGMPDMIDHHRNGYLAKPFDVADLACGISWVLADCDNWQRLSIEARRKVEREFSLKIISGKYVDLYREILEVKNQN